MALPETSIAYVPDVMTDEKSPAVKLDAVIPDIVLLPAAMVLLVNVSELDAVINPYELSQPLLPSLMNPELLVHWEMLALEKLDVVKPANVDSSIFDPLMSPDNVEVPKFKVNPAPVAPPVNVPVVVMLEVPDHVESAVFSTLPKPTWDFVSVRADSSISVPPIQLVQIKSADVVAVPATSA